MTGAQRTRATSPTTNALRLALAGVAISLSALALAGQANADPDVPTYPTPSPTTPGAGPPAPSQPIVQAADAPVAPAPPPPAGAPTVPEIPNPQYGQGSSPGPLGFLRDAWHQAHDPYGFISTPPGETNRVFILEKHGRVIVITNLAAPTRTTAARASLPKCGAARRASPHIMPCYSALLR